MENLLASLLVVFGTVVTLLISRLLHKSFFAPVGFFGLVWGASLVMFSATTVGLSQLSHWTWVAIATSWTSFVLGGILATLFRPPRRHEPPPAATERLDRNLVILVAVLALAGPLRFMYVINNLFGLSRLLTDPLVLRAELTHGTIGTGGLTVVFQGVIYMAAIFCGRYARWRPSFLPVYAPILAAVMFDTLFLGRFQTINTTVLFLAGRQLSRGSVRQSRRVPFLKRLALVLVFVLAAGMYGGITKTRQFGNGADGDFAETVSRVIQPYVLSFSHNWYLADIVVSRDLVNLRGVHTFFVPRMVLYKLGLLEEDPRKGRLFDKARRTESGSVRNTYPVVAESYSDFRWAGVVAVPAFLGFLTTWFWLQHQRKKQRLWPLVGAAFSFPIILFSILGSQLGSVPFVSGMVIGLGLGLWRDFQVRRLARRERLFAYLSLNPRKIYIEPTASQGLK